MPAFIIMLLLSVWFFDLWPFYSGHFRPLAREHDYFVRFYDPNNHEHDLGQVSGLENCRFRAQQHAEKKRYEAGRWTYRCCRLSRDGTCTKTEM